MADAPQVPFDEPREERGPAPTEAGEVHVTAERFEAAFGEPIERTLNLDTWRMGRDLGDEYGRIRGEVEEAVGRESDLQMEIRARFFPKLQTRKGAPKNAGVHPADLAILKRIHETLLFQGGVEACDGNLHVHDTLPLTIYQIGVGLVSYQGERGTWRQRLFRKDLRHTGSDPVGEAIAMLERRQQRADAERDALGEMARNALLQYAERAVLAHRSEACWRIGHGNPITYELMTGGSNVEIMVGATNVLRRLIEGHQKFIFVSSEPRERMLMTLAQALPPWHFAIVGTLDERLEGWFHQRRFSVDAARRLTWDDEVIPAAQWIPRLIREVASKVVVGLVRAAPVAPAHVFYAHVDHADYAAHVLLADSALQEHRGSPLLTELARHVCDAVFGDSLEGFADSAYAAAGVPWRYGKRLKR